MRRGVIWLVTGLLALLSGVAGAGLAQTDSHPVRISQKDQRFRPNVVTLKRGDSLLIVNDDGDLLHHAYVSSDSYKFDSGDEEPGQSVTMPFPVAGTFDVLCGIHPKMRLKVTVQ